MSGGSDCHGNKEKEIKPGIGYGNLNINKKIIENWSWKINEIIIIMAILYGGIIYDNI